jgi:hypothetical protein
MVSSKRKSGGEALSHTIHYLSVCKDPNLVKQIIKSSPDSVVKTICNAALNVERGDVRLTESHKRQLRKHRKGISLLTSRKVPLKRKRKALTIGSGQRGGFLPLLAAAIPGILGAVLGSIPEFVRLGRGE